MTTQTEAQRLALALYSARCWHELTDDDCDKAAAELRRLESEKLDMDRLLMASVPHRWKSCKSPVGAVQSYIAELEAANEELMESLVDVSYSLEKARIWGGMEWKYNQLHPVHYLPARDKARAAIAKHGGAA